MAFIETYNATERKTKLCLLLGLGTFFFFTSTNAMAQNRDERGYDDHDRLARLDVGTTIPVRLNESIDVDKGDNRVYTGTADADVRGDNGRIVVPRGVNVELMVRYTPDNDLNVDLESIVVNGQRYAIRTDEKHIESQRATVWWDPSWARSMAAKLAVVRSGYPETQL